MKKVTVFVCAVMALVMLAVPVCAAGFTPSVEQKGAPVAKERDVKVTALADLDTASEEVKQAVTQAYNSIVQAGSLGKAVPELENTLAQRKTPVKAENLVVRDLFHVSTQTAMNEGDRRVITFQAEGLKKGDFLMVMVFVDGQWVILDEELVEITKDGEARITFPVLGPVAFVTEKKA